MAHNRPANRPPINERIEQNLDKLGFKRQGLSPKEIIKCRAPSCDKRIPREFTRNGYCEACVRKAAALKAERERRARLEREDRHFYDNDEHFGVF